MTNIKNKRCGNCGAVMIYNNLLNRWECKLCGNVEGSSAIFGTFPRRFLI